MPSPSSFAALPNSQVRDVPGEGTPRADSTKDQKLKKAAGEFESLLLSNLWKSMKQSFATDDDDSSDPAHDTLDDFGVQAMSDAVGKNGGLGIGRLILKHLEDRASVQSEK